MDSNNVLSIHHITCLTQLQKDNRLLEAARYGHTATVSDLLAAGANINAVCNENGFTALTYASENGHISTVSVLIKTGANVNAAPDAKFKISGDQGITALMQAAYKGHTAIVSALLAAGANFNATYGHYSTPVLLVAAEAGQTAVLSALLAAGADINGADMYGRTALFMALKKDHPEIVSALVQAGAVTNINAEIFGSDTPLIKAAAFNSTASISVLLKAGAEVNKTNQLGETPLTRAAEMGSAASVCLLLKSGAGVNAVSRYGRTPLLLAALGGSTTTVSTLIEADANLIHVDQYGNTALILAAMNGHMGTVETLLAADLNTIHVTNRDGNTALMLASLNGHIRTVSTLLAAGASSNVTNHINDTALIMATQNNHRETAFRLVSTMPFQSVLVLQAHPIVGYFARLCDRAVLDLQREILTTLFIFRRSSRRSPLLSEGPVQLVLSHILPEWYRHRAGSDVRLLSQKLNNMLRNRPGIATVPLTLTTSALTLAVSNLKAEVPAASSSELSTSKVVAYTPVAAAMKRVAGAFSSCRRNRNENDVPAQQSNKKARRD